MKLDDCHCIDDLRRLSARVLPRPIFDYLDGGADDEFALRRSVSSFDDIDLLPRMLVDVSRVSTEVEIFGKRIPSPIMLAPTGLTRLFHKDAELAVAAAAAAAGLPYCLSTMGTTTIEEFAKATMGPRLFQIYIFKDRGLTEEFVERARACHYDGLVLTVDTVVTGKRRRDLTNGLSLPPRLTLRSWLDFAMKPRWSLPALFGRKFEIVNVSHRVNGMSDGSTSLHDYVSSQFDRTLTWRDVEWLAGKWQGPLAIKGILTPEDARQAVACGADTVMVSNHGGRQLETAVAPIEQIASIADAVAGRAKIICDGGVRRGTHILKALALGADACSIGRSYLYGLAAGGAAGVTHGLRLLTEELERSMILAGVPSVKHVGSGLIRPAARQRALALADR